MEPQTARYNQYSRAESSKMASGHHQPPGGGEGNDGRISDFSLTEGRRKRRSSIGDKVASLVGLNRNKSNSATVIIIAIIFIVVVVKKIFVVIIIAQLAEFLNFEILTL